MIPRVIAVLSLAFLSTAATAQNQESSSAEAPRIRSDVREVVVPVVVTDSRGHHISGLNASDFQVFEDGKPERIVSFRAEGGSLSAASSPAEIRGGSHAVPRSPATFDDPRRTYLILVDTLHSSFASFGRIREALGKFLEKEQGADAQYALIALGRETVMVQDSTRDASDVLAAVRNSGFDKLITESQSANLAATADQFTGLVREYCAVCRCLSAGKQKPWS